MVKENILLMEKILRYRTFRRLEYKKINQLRLNLDFLIGSDLCESRCYIKQTLNNLFVTLSTKLFNKHVVRYNFSLGQVQKTKLNKHHRNSGDTILKMGVCVGM